MKVIKTFGTYFVIGAASSILGFGILVLNNIPLEEISHKGIIEALILLGNYPLTTSKKSRLNIIKWLQG